MKENILIVISIALFMGTSALGGYLGYILGNIFHNPSLLLFGGLLGVCVGGTFRFAIIDLMNENRNSI